MARVLGLKKLLSQLERKQKKQTEGMARGLKRAGLFLQAESQKIVPVEFGPLKASAFTRSWTVGMHTEVVVGYTAAYAVIVHEDLELRHGAEYNAWYAEEIAAGLTKSGRVKKGWKGKTSRGENQQAKFLEQPFRQKRAEMRAIINQSMGI